MDTHDALDTLVALIVAGIAWFLQHYIKGKAQNLATKEDVSALAFLAEKAKNAASREDLEELTRVVESVRSDFRIQEELLRRASRVHEMQVRALTQLYADLSATQEYLQEMTKPFRFEGEDQAASQEEFFKAAQSALKGFRKTRLLLPRELVDRCQAFFPKLTEALVNRHLAQSGIIPPGPELADAWKKAYATASHDLPALLESIEAAARVVIHGDGARAA
jgi:hypothetical protein